MQRYEQTYVLLKVVRCVSLLRHYGYMGYMGPKGKSTDLGELLTCVYMTHAFTRRLSTPSCSLGIDNLDAAGKLKSFENTAYCNIPSLIWDFWCFGVS